MMANDEQKIAEAIDRFVDASGIVAPRELVEDEAKWIAAEVKSRKRYENIESGEIDVFLPGANDLAEDFWEEADRSVRTRLVIDYIIESEDLSVTKEELEAEAHDMAERQNMSMEDVKGFLGEDFAMLKQDLLTRKAVDYICANTIK